MLLRLKKLFLAWGITAFFTVLIGLGTVSPAAATTCSGTSVNSWSTLTAAIPVSGSGTICLSQDISKTVASGQADNLAIPSGSSVTLDLAGHTLVVDARLSNYVAGINVPAGASIVFMDSVGGGTVTAYAGEGSAGIGGNQYESSGTISVTSGTVNAYGGPAGYVGGAGIGAGAGGGGSPTILPSAGVINISGGTVTAQSFASAAGIGGGYLGDGGTITISGGTVSAVGVDGAGIGSGYDGSTFTIAITGGTVVGNASIGFAAGIGAGSLGGSGTVNISGGANVRAIAGALQTLNPKQGIGPTSGFSASTVTVGQSTLATTGSVITLASSAPVTNASFAGWVITGNNTLRAPSSTVTFAAIEESLSISPGITATVTYDSNGGGVAPSSTTYTSLGSPVSVSSGSGLSKTGYSFLGWNTAADGSGSPIQSGGQLTPNANTVLYAQWQVVPLANTGLNTTSILVGAAVLVFAGVLSHSFSTRKRNGF